jgi:transcriptional regulator with XRE-family HTH domain
MEEERRARLAYVIRAAREMRDLNVAQLADALGVAHSTVYAWEKGEKAPSLLMLGPLCDALGLSPMVFRDLPEEPPSPLAQYLEPAAERAVARVVRRSGG